MGDYKVTAVNGEWMNDWFVPGTGPAAWRPTFKRDNVMNDTAATATRLAALIRATDADVIGLAEAPSRPSELALFIADHLSSGGQPDYEFVMGTSGAAQKLAVLWKRGRVAVELAPDADIGDLLGNWDADVNGDGEIEPYHFTRSPVVAAIELDGRPMTLVVAHLKSNFINAGQDLWENLDTRLQFVREALTNRRRIANEAMRIRTFLDRRLAAQADAPILVLGDLNDGPGRDYFEERYLAHNVTDLVVGSPWEPERVFHHAQSDVPAARRYTAVFDDYVTGEKDKQLLLDHIVCSPGLSRRRAGLRRIAGSGAVEHTAWEQHRVEGGSRRDQRATDHRPVSVLLRAGVTITR